MLVGNILFVYVDLVNTTQTEDSSFYIMTSRQYTQTFCEQLWDLHFRLNKLSLGVFSFDFLLLRLLCESNIYI